MSYSNIDISAAEAEAMNVTESQCHDCIHRQGFDGCAVFKKCPDKYVYVSANCPCPNRKTNS